MSDLVQVTASGELRLPPETHPWKPNTPLRVRVDGDKLVLAPAAGLSPETEAASTLWHSRTPTERVAALREWVASLPQRHGPPIPDEALRRENMYD